MATPKRTPRPRDPAGPERTYTEELRRFSREISRALRAHVLPKYTAAVRDGTVRVDAEDRLGIDWGRLRTMIGRMAVDRAGELADGQVRRVNRFNLDDMDRILPIDLEAEPPAVRRALERARRENVALVKSIAAEQLTDVRALVRESAGKGRRVEDLANDLRERFGVSESRAELIAIDQTLKTNSDLSAVRFKEAGVERYVWSTSRDEKVRPMHAALEGRIFTIGDPPVVNEQGDRLEPGQDVRCRCVRLAVLG